MALYPYLTTKGALVASVVAASVMAAGPASATIGLEFFINGSSVQTVNDGDAADNTGTTGIEDDKVGFNGTLSNGGSGFSVDLSFARQRNNTITEVGSMIESLTIGATTDTKTGDMFRIVATAPDLTVPGGTGERSATSSITPDTLENFQLDYLTTVDGQTVLDATDVPQSPPADATANTLDVNITTNPYTIVHDATFTAQSGVTIGDAGSFDSSTEVSVPAPAALGLLGAGLIGLGAISRRRTTGA